MSTYLNQQWLDENEQRNYPFDSLATLIDDQGNNLPNEIITDLRILYDKKYGDGVYVSSILISELLVTVTIVATQVDPFLEFGNNDDIDIGELGIQPLAVVQALRRDAAKGQTFKLESLQNGVAGWISFGQGVTEVGAWSFSTAEQSCLHSRAYSRIDYGGVTTVGPDSSELTLDGLVKLLGRSGVKTEVAVRNIYDEDTLIVENANCLIISLDDGNPQNFALLAGECGVRPDSDNCGKEGIRFFAGVSPDINGNVNLIFDPIFAGYPTQYKDEEGYPFSEKWLTQHGLALELKLDESTSLNLEDLCETKEPRINSDGTFPGDVEGDCPPEDIELPEVEFCFCQDVYNDPPLQMDIWYDPDPGDPVLETVLFSYSGTGPGDRYRVFSEINPSGEQRHIYVHCSIGAWQLLEGDDVKVYWFGSMDSQCEDVSFIEDNDINYSVAIGPQLEVDSDEYPIAPVSGFWVTLDSGEGTPEIVGHYCRKYRGRYVHIGNDSIELRLSLAPGNQLGVIRYAFYYNNVLISDHVGFLTRGEDPERFIGSFQYPPDEPDWSVVIRSYHVDEGPCI